LEPIASPDDAEKQRSLRSAAMLTAGLGLAHAVLFMGAILLLASVPRGHDPTPTVLSHYLSTGNRLRTLTGLYIMPFAGIAFLWFIVALRMWIAAYGKRENVLLSNVQLVSGILYVGLFFVSAAAISVTAAGVELGGAQVDPAEARAFPQFGFTLLGVFALKMGGTFILATSKLGLGYTILPKWFAYGGLVMGVCMLLGITLDPRFALMFPIWLGALSTFLFLRARQIPRELPLPATLPPQSATDIPPFRPIQ
jgi:hypothetical protein